MQYQEPNNNQTLLALPKATEWERGGLFYPPCTSSHVYGLKFKLPEYTICRIGTIFAYTSRNSKMP